MSDDGVRCLQCGASVAPPERFCEGCGAILSAVSRIAVPRAQEETAEPCSDCGDGIYVGEYCAVCGNRRPEPDRDEATVDGVILVTDRGVVHTRNEDAAAAGTLARAVGEAPYARAVAVCDGVSSSRDPQVAARGASIAGVTTMLNVLASDGSSDAAVLAGMAAAAETAAAAGADNPDPMMAPSCTYVAATIVTTPAGEVEITVGSVGDSRAYWLPEPPEPAQCLTVDDSVAQELITAGVAADSAAVLAGEHTLTRWLGADAEAIAWSESSVHTITAPGRGTLVLCTDGLWNYLPAADDIARICADHEDPTAAACALVDHAIGAGGHDNITVAVIPIGGQP